MAKWYERVGSELSKLGKEASKGAAVAAREVERGAKIAASEVRKTVGIGVGDVKLNLEKLSFRAGETIRGTIKLTLSEPTEAKRLVVRLTGTRNKVSYAKGESGRNEKSTHTETIHDFEVEVGGNQSYESGEFAFELPIPADLGGGAANVPDGVLGDVARVVASVASINKSAPAWSVSAFLDIPWKRNVSGKVDVVVAAADDEK